MTVRHEVDSTNEREPERRIDRSGALTGSSDSCGFEISPETSPSLEDSLDIHFAYVHAQQVRRKFVHVLAAAGIFVWFAAIESQRMSAIVTDAAEVVWAVSFAAVALAAIREWRLRSRWERCFAKKTTSGADGTSDFGAA